jgi:general L-amino acid transport system permease protein
MVGHFISLFKDTSLVIVLGLSDLLRTARRSAVSLEFQGRQREALLFAALVFFIAAFSMSRWSQRLEARLGLGER